MSCLTVFWILHITAMVVLLVGCWINVSIWLQGHCGGQVRPSLGQILDATRRVLMLRLLRWPWETPHYWTFIFHSTIASAPFTYLPFSEFFHFLASPLVATVNSLAKGAQVA